MRAQVPEVFYHIDTYNGLSGNDIVYILQLDDGRMVFTTENGVNIYDGLSFSQYPRKESAEYHLSAYHGAYRVYIGRNDVLWIKNWYSLVLLDLRHERYISSPSKYLGQLGINEKVHDVFVDRVRSVWAVTDQGLRCPGRKLKIPLKAGYGRLQDVDVYGSRAYLFFSTGEVRCFRLKDGRQEYVRAAYPRDRIMLHSGYSRAIQDNHGKFYQKRSGEVSILLSFDARTRAWTKLLEVPYVLHTVLLGAHSDLYVSCGKGLWSIDLNTEKATYHPKLTMADGGQVVPQVNTVFRDRQGGWWLGTYDKGLLYGNSLRNSARGPCVHEARLALEPLLVGVTVNGKPLAMSPDGEGGLVDASVPYVRNISFGSGQDNLSFTFSALNYALPTRTAFRYRLLRNGQEVCQWAPPAQAESKGEASRRGVTTISFADMAHGDYLLQVKASADGRFGNAKATQIRFTIAPPWWLAWWACVLYAILLVAMLCGMLYVRRAWKERDARERVLMQRVQELIKRCNQFETVETESGSGALSADDNAFVKKAIALVEDNIGSSYGVEQLSRDLCMERTGLYKKLSALLDQSPSMFIRSIRLRKAASLLANTDKTVADIAALTGFSSPSYFGKCFFDEYGVKPSEYAMKSRKK